jgi:hypothetical protein
MPGKDKYCVGCGQRLGEGYRFCPNCGTPRPTDSVQASPAPVLSPEERSWSRLLGEELEEEESKQAPVEETLPAERSWSRLLGEETARVPTPEPEVPTPPPPTQVRIGVTQDEQRNKDMIVAAIAGALLGGAVLTVLLSAWGWALLESLIIASVVGVAFWLHILWVRPKRRGESGRFSFGTAPVRSRTIPQWVKIAVAARDGGTCRQCGSNYELQYDHIIPFSRGGSSTDVNNIQLLCGRCNRRKSNRYVG